MKKGRFSESEIVKILKTAETGLPVSEVCRSARISQATFYKWRSTYGGMDLPKIKRLKELEEENRRLKKM